MDGMTDSAEVTLLREFFKKWCALHALGSAPGRKSREHMDAAAELVQAADAVKNYVVHTPTEAPVHVSADAQALRQMQTQVAAIPPKDGFKEYGKH